MSSFFRNTTGYADDAISRRLNRHLSNLNLPCSSNTEVRSNTCPVSITTGSSIIAYVTASQNRSGGSSSSSRNDETTCAATAATSLVGPRSSSSPSDALCRGATVFSDTTMFSHSPRSVPRSLPRLIHTRFIC